MPPCHAFRSSARPERVAPQSALPAARSLNFLHDFPFGAGTRICIGEGFAWMEGVLLLATLAQKWRLEAVHDVRPQAVITLRPHPETPLRMRVKRREASPQ